MAVALPVSVRVIVCASAKVTPPVSTVSVVLSPSATVVADTLRVNCGTSLSWMVISTLPIGVVPSLAAMAMVSRSSSRVSSTAVTVALPEVSLAAMVMLAGAIV